MTEKARAVNKDQRLNSRIVSPQVTSETFRIEGRSNVVVNSYSHPSVGWSLEKEKDVHKHRLPSGKHYARNFRTPGISECLNCKVTMLGTNHSFPIGKEVVVISDSYFPLRHGFGDCLRHVQVEGVDIDDYLGAFKDSFYKNNAPTTGSHFLFSLNSFLLTHQPNDFTLTVTYLLAAIEEFLRKIAPSRSYTFSLFFFGAKDTDNAEVVGKVITLFDRTCTLDISKQVLNLAVDLCADAITEEATGKFRKVDCLGLVSQRAVGEYEIQPAKIRKTSEVIEGGYEVSEIIDSLCELFDVLREHDFYAPDTRSISAALYSSGRLSRSGHLDSMFSDFEVEKDSEMLFLGHSSAKRLADLVNKKGLFHKVTFLKLSHNFYEEDLPVELTEIVENKGNKKLVVVFYGFMRGTLVRSSWKSFNIDQVKHFGYDIDMSPLSTFDAMASWVRKLVVFLLPKQKSVAIIPPSPSFFDRCCRRDNHFKSSFDPVRYNRTLMCFEEYLCRSRLIQGRNGISPVLLMRSLTSDLVYQGNYLAEDGHHMSDHGLEMMANNLGRNRISLLNSNLSTCDLNAEQKIRQIVGTFESFVKTIDFDTLPKFVCPDRIIREKADVRK